MHVFIYLVANKIVWYDHPHRKPKRISKSLKTMKNKV